MESQSTRSSINCLWMLGDLIKLRHPDKFCLLYVGRAMRALIPKARIARPTAKKLSMKNILEPYPVYLQLPKYRVDCLFFQPTQ